ncbi:MAG: hypothetical protein WC757_04875 [Candidatus Paceibacterota bacterium]|jgi:hypothetical protein
MSSPEVVQEPEVFAYEDGFVPENAEEVRSHQTEASAKELAGLLNLEGKTIEQLQRAIFFDMKRPDVGTAEKLREADALLKVFPEADADGRKDIVKRLVEIIG